MTDDELRRKIAELKGYTKGAGRMDIAYYCGFDWWHTPTGGKTSILPNWPVDIQDAWELVEEIKCIGIRRYDNNIWYVGVYSKDGNLISYKSDESISRAICLAYIAYREAQG